MSNRDFFEPFFKDLFGELDRAFHDVGKRFREQAEHRPTINVTSSEQAVAVTASLPDVDPQSLQVSLPHSDRLAIAYRLLQDQAAEGGAEALQREVSLPFPVDADSARAEFRGGVLLVSMQAASGGGPRTVPVTVAD